MTSATASTGTVRLVGGIAVATILSGTAVLVVAQAGCDDPGGYAPREEGVTELVGGCVGPEDLPIAPEVESGQHPLIPTSDPAVAP